MDELLIKKLDRCLLFSQPVLFTGAGFSLGATNGAGDCLPSGNDLKTKIITDLLGYKINSKEYDELIISSLSDICSYAEGEIAPQKLQDYIIATFSECTPKPFHKIIVNYSNWKKIYTVNIDDVFENASEKGSLIVQNDVKQFSYSRANQREYIKLHGCVRNRSGKFVFSNQQYVDSMLNSTDYRFSSFARDMQIENFVIVGTEMNEINLDYYLTLFSSVSDKTSHGQLFFIQPSPSRIFKSKIAKVGAYLIEWTTEQLAEHLLSINKNSDIKYPNYQIEDFLCVKDNYDRYKNFKDYKSYLYFGQHPNYKDIIFDWDFINPDIELLYKSIKKYVENDSDNKLMISLYGKSLTGKSTYLKRLAVKLVNDNVVVYDFCGKRFDVKDICSKCKNITDNCVAIIFDNASFYYSEICHLIKNFPDDKKIVVICSARTYAHNRKRYSLVSEPWFKEIHITGNTKSENDIFAQMIEKRLDDKGLLGKLKSKSIEERIQYISSFSDVESFLFSITRGKSFQSRQLKNFYERKDNLRDGLDLLQQLAIIYKLDLPYLPLEIVRLIYNNNFKYILSCTENFVTYNEDANAIYIRDSFIVPHLLENIDHKKCIQLLTGILTIISPQVLDCNRTYWNEIASTLMKCKLLRSVLHLTNKEVKNLLNGIKSFYNDDYNYWLQVGLSEQHDSEYELALNHFLQAESMSPSSYTVRNAIARNYLRQANEIDDFGIAMPIHEEGVKLMKQLIHEREEFQVKAYSTHCLLFERIRFYQRNNYQPNDEILNEMYNMLKYVIDKDPDGPMSKHISNVFAKFLKNRNLTNKLPKLTLYDIKYLKPLMEDSDIRAKDYLEDFEMDI